MTDHASRIAVLENILSALEHSWPKQSFSIVAKGRHAQAAKNVVELLKQARADRAQAVHMRGTAAVSQTLDGAYPDPLALLDAGHEQRAGRPE